MLLSGDAIRQRQLIEGASEDGYRDASYDLHIGKIIDPAGEERTAYRLPAQGIVAVISRETVNIPKNVAGFAMVKTSLCKDGVLAINIGIIDPGYSNAISSFLINFSKDRFLLSEGQVFLRLTFFEYDQPPKKVTAQGAGSVTEYIHDIKQRVVKQFSKTFLDLNATINNALDNAFSRYQKRLIILVPAFGLMLTLLAFILNFGSLWLVQKWLQPSDQTKVELLREKLDEQGRTFREQNRTLEQRLNVLQGEVDSLRNRPTASPPRSR